MNTKLNTYLLLAKFFSSILDKDTEVVLHEIHYVNNSYETSIVYIGNSISGRTLESPSTDFLTTVIKTGQYKETDFVTNYISRSANGKLLISSSFFIKDCDENLIGMLCVNSDKTKHIELERALEFSLNSIQSFLKREDIEQLSSKPKIDENLYLSLEHSIEQSAFEILGESIINNDIKLTKKQKLDIVSNLYHKGYFELKGSISRTANFFCMSEVSIYKYLQIIKNENRRESTDKVRKQRATL